MDTYTDCICKLLDKPTYHARDNPHSVSSKWSCKVHGDQERYWRIHEGTEPFCVPCRSEAKGYDLLLKNAPEHDTVAFLDYLRAHNTVVLDNPQWLVIENFKYHTPEKPWLTAFHKIGDPDWDNWWQDLDILYYHNDWGSWEWLKKSADKQTVKRFHIHIYKP